MTLQNYYLNPKNVVFCKKIMVDQNAIIGIFNFEGTFLCTTNDYEMAYQNARQHGFEPVMVN